MAIAASRRTRASCTPHTYPSVPPNPLPGPSRSLACPREPLAHASLTAPALACPQIIHDLPLAASGDMSILIDAIQCGDLPGHMEKRHRRWKKILELVCPRPALTKPSDRTYPPPPPAGERWRARTSRSLARPAAARRRRLHAARVAARAAGQPATAEPTGLPGPTGARARQWRARTGGLSPTSGGCAQKGRIDPSLYFFKWASGLCE